MRAVGENLCSAKVSSGEKKSGSRVERSYSQKGGLFKILGVTCAGKCKIIPRSKKMNAHRIS